MQQAQGAHRVILASPHSYWTRNGPPVFLMLSRLVALGVTCGAFACNGCSRRAPPPSLAADGAGPRELWLRAPAALSIARAIDSLSVSVDPASLADTSVQADSGMFIGVEAEFFVFPLGQARPAVGRRTVQSSADFSAVTATWNTKQDGIPAPGTKYVAEMNVVLFETDAAPDRGWEPHFGHYESLWTRTLRQAEE